VDNTLIPVSPAHLFVLGIWLNLIPRPSPLRRVFIFVSRGYPDTHLSAKLVAKHSIILFGHRSSTLPPTTREGHATRFMPSPSENAPPNSHRSPPENNLGFLYQRHRSRRHGVESVHTKKNEFGRGQTQVVGERDRKGWQREM